LGEDFMSKLWAGTMFLISLIYFTLKNHLLWRW